jgi:hypothetical protein
MGFIWAGARALRRTHLGRFAKLRSDTAWLEGTLFESDNPGQTGNRPPLDVLIVLLHMSCIICLVYSSQTAQTLRWNRRGSQCKG